MEFVRHGSSLFPRRASCCSFPQISFKVHRLVSDTLLDRFSFDISFLDFNGGYPTSNLAFGSLHHHYIITSIGSLDYLRIVGNWCEGVHGMECRWLS